MLRRHPLFTYLYDSVHLATHVTDRIDPTLVLDGACHLPAGPPHDGGGRTGCLNYPSPNTKVSFYVDTRTPNRQNTVIGERERDCRCIWGIVLNVMILGQCVFYHWWSWSGHHGDGQGSQGAPGP